MGSGMPSLSAARRGADVAAGAAVGRPRSMPVPALGTASLAVVYVPAHSAIRAAQLPALSAGASRVQPAKSSAGDSPARQAQAYPPMAMGTAQFAPPSWPQRARPGSTSPSTGNRCAALSRAPGENTMKSGGLISPCANAASVSCETALVCMYTPGCRFQRRKCSGSARVASEPVPVCQSV